MISICEQHFLVEDPKQIRFRLLQSKLEGFAIHPEKYCDELTGTVFVSQLNDHTVKREVFFEVGVSFIEEITFKNRDFLQTVFEDVQKGRRYYFTLRLIQLDRAVRLEFRYDDELLSAQAQEDDEMTLSFRRAAYLARNQSIVEKMMTSLGISKQSWSSKVLSN